jgi:hypothetical protein
MRKMWGADVIAILQPVADGGSQPARLAVQWLRANLTDAARVGCHHCGEAEHSGAPCRWCGLRDKPRRVQP